MLIAALAVLAAGASAHDALAWQRDRILAGEVWRLVTGHLVHGGPLHALLNIAAGAVLLVLPDGGANARQWATALLVTVLTVGLGLMWPSWPDVYVGLSGVLHGMIAWLACRCADRAQPGWMLIAGLLWLKIGAEQWLQSDLGTGAIIGMPVAIDAHLFGAAAGTVHGLVARRQARSPADAA